ncbi:MAG: hypothetical protein AAF730_15900 [Bacteroidota bacterium]
MPLRAKQVFCVLGITSVMAVLFFLINPSLSAGGRTVSVFQDAVQFIGLFGTFWLASVWIIQQPKQWSAAKPVIFGVAVCYGLVVALGTTYMLFEPLQYINWKLALFGGLSASALSVALGCIAFGFRQRRLATVRAA